MKEQDFLDIWKSYDQKLSQSLAINKKNTLEITQLKLQSLLQATRSGKRMTILIGIVWVLILFALSALGWAAQNPYLGLSMGLMALLNCLAIGIYLYHLILIQQVDVDQKVAITQRKLASLRASTLQIPRILFLQLPLWTTFYLTPSMMADSGILLYAVQLPITLAFLGVSIWLFINIKYKNKDQKWFQWIFQDKEWNNTLRAQDLIDELNSFETQN
ncbi:MAG: hypothetical protein AB8H47_25205 [Bacteroidia bacterium]